MLLVPQISEPQAHQGLSLALSLVACREPYHFHHQALCRAIDKGLPPQVCEPYTDIYETLSIGQAWPVDPKAPVACHGLRELGMPQE